MYKSLIIVSLALVALAGCKKELSRVECPTVSKIEAVTNKEGGIIDHKITLSNGSIVNKALTRLTVGDSYCN